MYLLTSFCVHVVMTGLVLLLVLLPVGPDRNRTLGRLSEDNWNCGATLKKDYSNLFARGSPSVSGLDSNGTWTLVLDWNCSVFNLPLNLIGFSSYFFFFLRLQRTILSFLKFIFRAVYLLFYSFTYSELLPLLEVKLFSTLPVLSLLFPNSGDTILLMIQNLTIWWYSHIQDSSVCMKEGFWDEINQSYYMV